MKGQKGKIVEIESQRQACRKVEAQQAFYQSKRVYLPTKVFIPMPTVFGGLYIEFRSSDKRTFLTDQSFKNSYSIVY